MKHFAGFRWRTLPTLGLLLTVLLPPPARAQTEREREVQAETLRMMEERLDRIREELARARHSDAEALARFEQAMFEVQEIKEAREREVQERARQLAEERALRARMLDRDLHRELAEARVQTQERGGEERARAREVEWRAQERMEQARLRSAEERARVAERVRRAQQVVVQVRGRARLGISLDPTQGEEYDAQGVRITAVMEGSPAEEAGLQEGDILTHLDGQALITPIPDEEELDFGEKTSLPVQRLLALARGLEDGQTVEVRFIRDGEARTATLEAAELDDRWVTVLPRSLRGGMIRLEPEGRLRWRYSLPEEGLNLHIGPWAEAWEHLEDLHIEIPEFRFEGFPSDTLGGLRMWRGERPNVLFYRGGGDDFTFEFLGRSRVHGLDLRELNAGLAEYFSTDRGVLVLEVEEDSRLGLRAGDVILSIGDRPVVDTRDVYRILGSYEKEEAVSFSVMRQGQEMRVEGYIG